MVTFVESAVRIALLLLVAGAASAQDISDLAGVAPGQVMGEVQAAASNVRSPMPFVFFGAPAAQTIVRSLLKPSLPDEVASKDRWRYQLDAELSSLMGQGR